MKEQASRTEPARLLRETQRLIGGVEGRTGRRVEIVPNEAIRGHGRAVYVASDLDPERHLIYYDPLHERFLDHLVAHECGHIIRLFDAPPEERAVTATTGEQRERIVEQLLPDIERLVRSGITAGAIAHVLPIWLSGTIAQLSNTPPDIHIERWIQRAYPELRGVQKRSLADQVTEHALALQPDVREVTPSVLWKASNAMNAALARSVADLCNEPDWLRPYRGTAAARTADKLLAILDGEGDMGLAGDRRTSERWAKHLGLEGWVTWTRLDHLPSRITRAWETHDQGNRTTD